VKPVADLQSALATMRVDIGIVATPAASAQEVIDALVKCGVKAILNYAPIAAHVPEHVHIKDIDPVLSLQSMTFYLKNEVLAGAR
jgi:redox-sensing transcriptional repressor